MLRVSVIIPVHNCRTYLEEAVKSAAANSDSEKEIIIIDDGSTDGTDRLLLDLQRSYPGLVRGISHPDKRNHGISASRNLGAQEAGGNVFAFLDADDRFLPEHLARAVDVLVRHPQVAFVYGRIRILNEIKEGGLSFTNNEWGWGPDRGIVPDAFERLLKGNFVPLQTVVCRREQFFEVGGFDEGLDFQQEDYILWTKIAYRYPLYYLDEVCAEYRVHPLSYSVNLCRERVASAEEIEYLERVSGWVPRSDRRAWGHIDSAWHQAGNRTLYRFYRALRGGDLKQARREVIVIRRVPQKTWQVIAPLRWWRARMQVRRGAHLRVGS